MEKKGTKIAYFIALAIVVIALVIAKVTNDGSGFVATGWALFPPVVAIALALISKEVYSSLFLGCLAGALLLANFQPWQMVVNFVGAGEGVGMINAIDISILIFLVMLGIMVDLMNKAGGSAAFGRWAQTHIKSRSGAQLATIVLGCLIFIDDYFNCLTVGSVMRPITDKHQVSRAKLAYLIDATAAPVCIIAPISSWAAAVAAFAEDGQGLNLFIQAIPYNFYALLTITMMIGLVLLRSDFGLMEVYEKNAVENGDLFSGPNPYAMMDEEIVEDKGRVLDLVLPILVLVVFCVTGMIYSGGFFSGSDFVSAFSNSDASVGLMLGSAFGLLFAFIYYFLRRSMSFKDMMGCIPEGFKAMVPAILILTFAWTLKSMTDSLGAKYFVRDFVRSAEHLQMFLPVIVFVIGCLLAFATGTSWGTMGILIPVAVPVFAGSPLLPMAVAAVCGGAVMGDHCSPISDTTIMSSTGAGCDHMAHVNTQLWYGLAVAADCTVCYLLAPALGNPWVPLAIGAALVTGQVFLLNRVSRRRAGEAV